MSETDRIYRITVIAAPEPVEVSTSGLGNDFFEELQTVTEFTVSQTTDSPPTFNAHQIEFEVERNLQSAPNTCNIQITNLAFPTRESLVGGPVKVRLEAGYDNTPRLLFLGDLRYASNEHEGTEWITKLQLADGGRAYANARVNKAYAKGTPINTIVKDLARAFGVPAPFIPKASDELSSRIASGEVTTGIVADELTRLLAPFGFDWSFQHGRLQLLREDQVVESVVRVISESGQDDNGGGMIGAPEMVPPKIIAPPKVAHRGGLHRKKPRVPKLKVKHTLYPEISPGEKIQIRSRSIEGVFRVDVVKHKGEFFGKDWITEIEATALKDVTTT